MAETGLLHHPWITRWTIGVDEYHRLAETGILPPESRVELIEGEVIAMSPIGAGHAGKVNRLHHLLLQLAGDRVVVSSQNPIRLSDRSEPQPDLAVLLPRADYYEGGLPTPSDVLLLIEVADSSLRFDREVKLPLYARHGIPAVWIVDLAGGAVEVYGEPGPGGYGRASRAVRGEAVEPLPGLRLPVGDILG